MTLYVAPGLTSNWTPVPRTGVSRIEWPPVETRAIDCPGGDREIQGSGHFGYVLR